MAQGTTGQRHRRTKRSFGSVRKLESGKWQARYPGPDGSMIPGPNTYATRALAERFLALVEADMTRGEWIDPAKGRVTFADWADQWQATIVHLKPKTRYGYESILRVHLIPHFGDWEVARIDRPAIQSLLAGLQAAGAAGGTVGNTRQVLRSVLSAAQGGGAIRANPCDGVRVPRSRRQEMHFLDHHQVAALAEAIAHPPIKSGGGEHRRDAYPDYGVLIRFAAYTGLRAGEIVALRAGRLNLLRRTAEVAEAASEVGGHLVFGAPKTYQRRRVPLPAALAEELVAVLAARGADDFVFTRPNGPGPLSWNNFYRRHFKPAAIAIGAPELRGHDLRHTYAGFLIAEGAHPRAMMERLGHSSISVTLDRYGHLLPGLEEKITEGLDAAYRGATPTPDAAVVSMRYGTRVARPARTGST